jgi:hypothetical protein
MTDDRDRRALAAGAQGRERARPHLRREEQLGVTADAMVPYAKGRQSRGWKTGSPPALCAHRQNSDP